MAKASLISHRSTSSLVQPAFANTFSIEPIGAVVNNSGSCELDEWATIRAKGFKPRALASDSFIKTSADAPSEIELELAGVMVPSLAKAGRKLGILSRRALPGCSSSSITVSLLRVLIVTGTISAFNEPSAIAFCARMVDSIAKASISSRLRLLSSAVP